MKFSRQNSWAANHKSSIWQLSLSAMVLVLLGACAGGSGPATLAVAVMVAALIRRKHLTQLQMFW